MAKSFLPSRESEFVTWVENFGGLIAAQPAEYGLTAQQAEEYGVTSSRFLELYAAASGAATRTPQVITDKLDQSRRLVNATRMLVRLIQAWPQITDGKRRALGITVPGERTPIGPPAEVPVLEVVAVVGRRVTVQFHGTDGRRRKPRGVQGATLYSFVGDAPPQDIAAWTNEGATSRTQIGVDFPLNVPGGATVWLTACWVNAKFQSGTACAPVSTRTNFDGLAKAA